MAPSASKASLQVLTGSLTGKLLNLITLVIVTPWLGPTGFGQLLIVGIILAVFNTVIDIGFENYYLFKVKMFGPHQTSEEDILTLEHVVFTMRLWSNLFLFAAQVALSYCGDLLGFDAPVDVYMRILSLNYLFNIFGKINEVRLRKRMNFGPVAMAKILGDLMGSIIKIVLVLNGFGIAGWAVGLVAASGVQSGMLTYFGNYKPAAIVIPQKLMREVIWYAKHSWLTGAGLFLHGQVSNIILKSFFPLQAIGFMQFGYSYTVEIQSGLMSSQLHVMLPYYSNFRHDTERIVNGLKIYINASWLVLGFPALTGLFFAEELIAVFFGKVWLPAAPVLSWYCLYVLVRVIFSPALPVLTALGKMKEGTVVTYFSFFFNALILVAVAYYFKDIYWFAPAYVLVSLITEGIKALRGLHHLKISLFNVLRACGGSINALVLTALCLGGFKFLINPVAQWMLFLWIAVAGGVFLLVQYVFNRDAVLSISQRLLSFSNRSES